MRGRLTISPFRALVGLLRPGGNVRPFDNVAARGVRLKLARLPALTWPHLAGPLIKYKIKGNQASSLTSLAGQNPFLLRSAGSLFVCVCVCVCARALSLSPVQKESLSAEEPSKNYDQITSSFYSLLQTLLLTNSLQARQGWQGNKLYRGEKRRAQFREGSNICSRQQRVSYISIN